MFRKGDTLIEVCIAIGIFSLIAIGVAAVMSSGTAGSQTALETTLSREEIDAQADALRFIHESRMREQDAGYESDAGSSPYSELWDKITANAIPADEAEANGVTQYNPSTCSSLYKSATEDGDTRGAIEKQKGFIVDTKQLSNPSGALKYSNNNQTRGIFTETSTYPRLVYDSHNELQYAEGLYIVAVRDKGTQMIIDDKKTKSTSAYYDFYIRSCWYGTDAERPTAISTVIRLYDPPATESITPITNTFKISYATEPDISWSSKPNDVTLVITDTSVNYTIEGQNPTKAGYNFVGYKVCSFNESEGYDAGLASCKPTTNDERIDVANKQIYPGSRITLVAKGEVTNVIIYPVFLQIVTVSARIDDTSKNPNEYGSISIKCQKYFACKNGKNNLTSANITVPVGDSVTATANEGRGYKFVNWSGNGETYLESKTWNFNAASSTTITAYFSLDVEKLTGIRVLNVYPNNGNNLVGWMNSYGRGKITVTSTSISNFNSKYSSFNANNYDAIVFGFWDCNSSVDLSDGAKTWVANNFLNKGKAILFGHDTINYGTDTCTRHKNFNYFAPYVGFNTRSPFYSNWSSGPYFSGTSVVINVNSIFVSYPWPIGSRGTKLTVPYSHTLQQYVTNNNNVYLKYNQIDTNTGNFYLTVNNSYNAAMIQTGHSNGAATAEEQKIIANTIFYMYSVYYKNTY